MFKIQSHKIDYKRLPSLLMKAKLEVQLNPKINSLFLIDFSIIVNWSVNIKKVERWLG